MGTSKLSQLKEIMRRYKTKILIFLVGAAATAVGLFLYINGYIYQSEATIPKVNIEFTNSTGPYNVGDEIPVNLRISGQEISAADIFLIYDNRYIEYTATSSEPGYTQLPENYFEPPLIQTVKIDQELGIMNILRLTLYRNKPDLDDLVQLNFKFRAKAAGTADFIIVSNNSELNQILSTESFDSVLPLTQIAGKGEENTPYYFEKEGEQMEVTTIAINTPTQVEPTDPQTRPEAPGDAQLNMTARFQGITGQPIDQFRTLSVQVTLESTDNSYSQNKTVQFNSEPGGIWRGSTIFENVDEEKTYTLLVKGPKHLRRKNCSNNPQEDTGGTYNCNQGEITINAGGVTDITMENIILLAGDLPIQNGIVDATDVIFIRENFGKTESSILSKADLNLDGIVDTQDYSLVLAALRFKYDEE